MVTQAPTPFDFVAETNGHCFLCSDKIYSSGHFHPSKSETFSIYSLHCLSRHLKMDMKKVFDVEGPLPSHLVTRVVKSKLKAELCQECASLTKTFTRKLRQLEKIQMENLTSGLSLIHQKLGRALKAGLGEGNSKTDDGVAKMKITESLRMEAMQKCSNELNKVHPVAKLQRLTGKQVNAQKLKIKLNYVKAERNESNHYHHIEAIESPSSPPISTADGMDYQEEPNHSFESPTDDANYGIRNETLKQDVFEASQYPDDPDGDLNREHPTPNVSAQQRQRTKAKNKGDELSEAIPPPIKLVGHVGIEKPETSLDPKTGKYKCGICLKEFSTKMGFQRHFDIVHLKVKHKCGECDKQFSEKSKYERHYLSVHLGVRFQCGKCNKTFSDRDNLIMHQKRAHIDR